MLAWPPARAAWPPSCGAVPYMQLAAHTPVKRNPSIPSHSPRPQNVWITQLQQLPLLEWMRECCSVGGPGGLGSGTCTRCKCSFLHPQQRCPQQAQPCSPLHAQVSEDRLCRSLVRRWEQQRTSNCNLVNSPSACVTSLTFHITEVAAHRRRRKAKQRVLHQKAPADTAAAEQAGA